MKVVIIGAGINGLYIAGQLAQRKNTVEVFEAKGAIGENIACSGLFSDRILGYFPEAENIILNRIKRVIIHFPGKSAAVAFSRDFLLIEHGELDKIAARRAEKAGVKINLNNPVKGLPEGFDRIIGCDGPSSFVRRQLKLENPDFRLGIQGFVPEKNDNDFVEVWPLVAKRFVCSNCQPKARGASRGFIWKIPRGFETEYGIIAEPSQAKILLDDFLKERNIKIERVRAKLIPQGLIIPDDNNITLCGDAAGLTKPWSGGGVIWGLRAADMLIGSFPDFKKYQNRAKGFFRKKTILSKLAVAGVYFIGFHLPILMPKKAKIESDYLF